MCELAMPKIPTVIRRLGTLSHLLSTKPSVEKRRAEVCVQPYGQWFSQSYLFNEISVKIPYTKAQVSVSFFPQYSEYGHTLLGGE